MTTFTIDIPDDSTEEVLTQLKKLGVKVRRSTLSKLDKLSKEDYERHFSHRSRETRNEVLKHL
jgi:glutamine synthetase adenylyltransferase